MLAAAAAGDERAFATFMDRHAAEVYRWVTAQGAQGADAEDALQEAFVAAWRGAATFRGEGAGGTAPNRGSARAWLLTIARNALRRAHRRRAGEPAQFEPVEAADLAGDDTLESVALATGWGARDAAVLSPDGDADDADDADDAGASRAHRVHAALAALAAADREIVTLRDLQGLSGEETAAALGLTLPAMKSRLHRARLRFAAAYRAGLPGGRDAGT